MFAREWIGAPGIRLVGDRWFYMDSGPLRLRNRFRAPSSME